MWRGTVLCPPPPPGTGPGITDPSGIHPQGARYVWNRTELMKAVGDPNVKYLMGNTCPPCQDVAATGTL